MAQMAEMAQPAERWDPEQYEKLSDYRQRPFEELMSRSVVKTVGGAPVRIAGIDDLIGKHRS